ncbi:MAG: nucleotidyltransferase family protein [Promethearchaeota archaeon]
MKLEEFKALILVGGLGTRLKKIVKDVPKPMADILGKPFLYYKIIQMKNAGIRNIIFCSGYMHKIIEDYFKDGQKFDIKIEYSIEEELLGTAGAIKNAEHLLEKNKPFFVLNGDTYLNVDFQAMLEQYKEKNALHLMLLAFPRRLQQVGNVHINKKGEITSFIEKPDKKTLKSIKAPYINGGVYLLSPEILDIIPKNQKCSLEKEIFPKIIGEGKRFYGFIYPKEEYFIDIGIPENYTKFIEGVKAKKIKIF